MNTWQRRGHYEFYRGFAQPHFNICAPVEITALRSALKDLDVSFTIGWLYLLTRAANSIPELRQRIRGDGVVEHDVVHPSITVLSEEGLFGFCFIEYNDAFESFARGAAERIDTACQDVTLEGDAGRADLLFMTAIPWLAFTGFMHPLPSLPPDSIPRFAWGRFTGEGARMTMPLSVQGHHALVDGVHVARLYEQLEEWLESPEEVLGTQ
jgi:chloramphenicol O-acetyltransferase